MSLNQTEAEPISLRSKTSQFYALSHLVDLKAAAFLVAKEKDFSASTEQKRECSQNATNRSSAQRERRKKT